MRQLASFLLAGFALCAGAAEVWRWKDANGNWHYSDNPVAGAERVNVQSSSPPKDAAQPAAAASTAAPEPPPAPVRYTQCAVTQPINDSTFSWQDPVPVTVSVEPALQSGHRLELLLNGSPYPGWPADLASYTLTGLFRGSYAAVARVLDANGRPVCVGPPTHFHLRQPTLLSPARQPAKK